MKAVEDQAENPNAHRKFPHREHNEPRRGSSCKINAPWICELVKACYCARVASGKREALPQSVRCEK